MQKSSAVAGIDWATELHAVCILDNDGKVIERFDVTHDSQALHVMVSKFRKTGVTKVAIERGDGPVAEGIDRCGGLRCSSPASRQIKALRTRHGSAGNKDDRLDAYVLADTLRTDGHRWRPLREDHPETKALRAMCRARKDLVETRAEGDEPAPVQPRAGVPWSTRIAAPPRQRRSRWPSCAGFRAQPKLRGSLRHVWTGGCDRSVTAAVSPRRRCSGTSTVRLPDSSESRQRLAGRSRKLWSPPSKR